MKLFNAQVEFLDMNIKGEKLIEDAGRTCWKSEGKKTPVSYTTFISKLKERGHFAMLEFSWFALRLICSRDISHQIVRHRHFSVAQESQHYIKYKNHIQFVIPCWVKNTIDKDLTGEWTEDMMDEALTTLPGSVARWLFGRRNDEAEYFEYINDHALKAQEARTCLPNACKTEVCIAGNGRSWCEFFDKRMGPENTQDMQEIARLCFEELTKLTVKLF